MRYFSLLLLPIFLCLIPACDLATDELEVKQRFSLFSKLDSTDTGLNFINKVEDQKDFNVLTYRNFYNGGGVAIGDINNDGLPDVYFTANMAPNRLYLNKGNWEFEDISSKAGIRGEKAWSTGVSMVDINADGFLDIYVCNSGDIQGDNKENELFINQGDMTFVEKAADYGLNDKGFSTHASFFDYDLDGDLDCYILNNSFKDPNRIDLYKKAREETDEEGGDKLFRNDGDSFTDVTLEAGIYNSQIGFGLGVSVSDLNGDMFPDIYVSNDFWERDYLYINQGNGKFSEELPQRISQTSVSSMGADIADINNDGSPEVFSTDMLAGDNYRLKAMTVFDPYHLEDIKYRANYHYQILQNCLQLNDGNANFQEIGFMAGISATDWSWGALMFDFENDGWKDIFVANGIYHDIMYMDFTAFISDQANVKKIVEESGRADFRDFLPYLPSNPLSNFAFVNNRNLQFSSEADALGLGEASFSNGAAYGDLDLDGDLDLIVNNVNMPAFIYRNNSDSLKKNHFLKINFKGRKENPLGIGAKVKITHAGEKQELQHYTARGFESSVEPGLLFGLGKNTQIDELEVIWPDRKKEVLKNLRADQTIVLQHENATEDFRPANTKSKSLFTENSSMTFPEKAMHTENIYNDFNHELLLPHMLSTEGPRLLKGDVNGDGREDAVLLGAAGDPDKLYIQNTSSSFRFSPQEAFEMDKGVESTGGALADMDQDGDLDLLLGAGGNEYTKGIQNFLLRYYENDGKGNFSKQKEKTPPAGGNTSCIEVADFDADGDMDVFIGGRLVPGNYGLKPRSFLLRKDPTGWTDITTEFLGGLGMITDAVWVDQDQDNDLDLVVVGEWLGVTLLKNEGGKLQPPAMIPNSLGWWNCIEKADLDGDGDEDFVLGNWGLNSKFQASPDRPLSMFVKDFDQNGKSEFVINWFPPLDDKAYPFATKGDITTQLPHLKRSNLKFEEYAHKTFSDLFSEEEVRGGLAYKADYLQSAILWNEANGTPKLQALPIEAQVSPVFGIAIADMDGDEHLDIVLGGNFYALKPEVGRQDANFGVFLKGNSSKDFQYLSPEESGIYLRGEVRDMKVFKGKDNKPLLMVARNNDAVLTFKRN
ncbi:MAG: VCBS repeat-containing protein [Bacteroidia bacterium]|nr:VCBS repeat-containing protein [Bacteroidia bacterium]